VPTFLKEKYLWKALIIKMENLSAKDVAVEMYLLEQG
jgi:hypothetical protein